MNMKTLLRARDCVDSAVKLLAAAESSSGPVWLALNAARNAQVDLDKVIAAEWRRLEALRDDLDALEPDMSDEDY